MKLAIWTGQYQYWQSVHPNNLLKADAPQMGGSEAAALSISRELAARGHDVLLGCKVGYPESFGRLRVCPLDLFVGAIFAGSYDALISWDDPSVFRYATPHIPLDILVFQLNDTHLGVYEHIIAKYFHPSKWHAQRFTKEFGVPEKKQVSGLIDGVDPKMFIDIPARQPRVIWASSPDRGLHHLLRMWPKVLEVVPEAELHIYYDMDNWLKQIAYLSAMGVTALTSDRAALIQGLLRNTPRMTYHGGVSKIEVATALLRAKVLAYPCEPVAPTEGFSMTSLEGWVAGCNVVLSDADALPELWGWREGVTCLPLPVDDDLWAQALVKGLEADIPDGPRLVPEDLTWAYKAQQWEEELCGS